MSGQYKFNECGFCYRRESPSQWVVQHFCEPCERGNSRFFIDQSSRLYELEWLFDAYDIPIKGIYIEILAKKCFEVFRDKLNFNVVTKLIGITSLESWALIDEKLKNVFRELSFSIIVTLFVNKVTPVDFKSKDIELDLIVYGDNVSLAVSQVKYVTFKYDIDSHFIRYYYQVMKFCSSVQKFYLFFNGSVNESL